MTIPAFYVNVFKVALKITTPVDLLIFFFWLFLFQKNISRGGTPKPEVAEMGVMVGTEGDDLIQERERQYKEQKRREYDEFLVCKIISGDKNTLNHVF